MNDDADVDSNVHEAEETPTDQQTDKPVRKPAPYVPREALEDAKRKAREATERTKQVEETAKQLTEKLAAVEATQKKAAERAVTAELRAAARKQV